MQRSGDADSRPRRLLDVAEDDAALPVLDRHGERRLPRTTVAGADRGPRA